MKRMRLRGEHAWIPVLALALASAGCLGKRRPAPGDDERASAAAAPAGGSAAAKVIGPDEVDDSLSKLVTGERKQVLVREGDPMKGSGRPLVTIVEFSDFQCPFCSRLAGTLEQVMADDPTTCDWCSSSSPCPCTKTPSRPRERPSPPRIRASSGRCTTNCSPTSERWDRRT